MDFLGLCQRVRQDAGVSGEGPTAVTGQTGILSRIVSWVKQANNEIQLKNKAWRFLWAQGSGNTIKMGGEYFPADFGLVKPRSIATFRYNTKTLIERDWDWYQREVKAAGKDNEHGIPTYFIVRPDEKILLFPIPADVGTVTIDYYRKPVQLVNGVDKPLLPEEYHEAIVCRALMLYAHYEEDTYLFQVKLAEFNQWINLISQTEQPQITFE